MNEADFLGALLRVNLVAGGAIVIVTALRRPVRFISGSRVAYGLWLLPVLASVAVLLPARRIVAAPNPPLSPASGIHVAMLDSLGSGSSPTISTLLLGLWLAGVLGTGVVLGRLQLRFQRAVHQGLAGPAVVGLIAPTIVTPRDFDSRFSPEERKLVLSHERTHVLRQDTRVNGLCCAAQCFGWFNPLIHIAAHLMRIDQELACDETLVTRFPDARRAYAEVLVKAQLAIWPPLGCNWPSASEHPLLERIAMLKRRSLSSIRRWAGASLIATLCAGASLTAWAAQPPEVQAGPAPVVGSTQIPPPVDISADSVRDVDAKHDTIWSGNASAALGDERLMADEIRAELEPVRLVAEGHVLYVSPRRTARADQAVYERAAHTLTLTGSVVAVQDQKVLRSEKLVIDLTQ